MRIHFFCVVLGAILLALPSRADTSIGTAVGISMDGDLLTNEHVISSCARRSEILPQFLAPGIVTIRQGNRQHVGAVRASDEALDLAVVRLWPTTLGPTVGTLGPLEIATLRQSPPLRAGEQAIAFGFPYAGTLATEGNLTVGYVSALRGLHDNPSYIQITTPIQPGNSGGPLLDSSGNLIGLVTAKLNAIKMMREFGDVPQNVNFAIELARVRSFLQLHQARFQERVSGGSLAVADIGERAKRFTYLVECTTQPSASAAPRVATRAPSPPPAAPPVDFSKLRFSEIRQPAPTLAPNLFEFLISNFGTQHVREITIGFLQVQGQQCPSNLEAYDGFKKFSVNLGPQDSIRLTGDLSGQARSFCIIAAR